MVYQEDSIISLSSRKKGVPSGTDSCTATFHLVGVCFQSSNSRGSCNAGSVMLLSHARSPSAVSAVFFFSVVPVSSDARTPPPYDHVLQYDTLCVVDSLQLPLSRTVNRGEAPSRRGRALKLRQ